MKDKLSKLFQNFIGSFDNGNGGYSAKKLSAFAIMVCVIGAHVKWLSLGNFTQLEMVLTIDYAFVCTLFGITSYDKRTASKGDAPKGD